MTTTPNFEELQSFSKHQLEALTAASTTWTKGMQELAAESTDYTKKTFAASSAVFEKLLGARSVEAAVQIQSEYAKQAYEGFVAQASKFSELYAKVASDALKPVTSAYAKSSGEVIAWGRRGPFLRSELRAGVLRETPVYFFLEPFAAATGDGGHAGAGNRP